MSRTKVWHGSLISGLNRFNPTTHFGSRLQACCAIVAHAALDNNTGTPSIYECWLDYQENEVLKLSDWHSPKPQALLLAYCTEMGKSENYTRGYKREAEKLKLEPDSETWIQWLVKATSPQGHKLFAYVNKVETTGISYCVLDTDAVTIIKSEKLSFADLAKKVLPLNKSQHGYNGAEWSKISEFLCAQND